MNKQDTMLNSLFLSFNLLACYFTYYVYIVTRTLLTIKWVQTVNCGFYSFRMERKLCTRKWWYSSNCNETSHPWYRGYYGCHHEYYPLGMKFYFGDRDRIFLFATWYSWSLNIFYKIKFEETFLETKWI